MRVSRGVSDRDFYLVQTQEYTSWSVSLTVRRDSSHSPDVSLQTEIHTVGSQFILPGLL